MIPKGASLLSKFKDAKDEQAQKEKEQAEKHVKDKVEEEKTDVMRKLSLECERQKADSN